MASGNVALERSEEYLAYKIQATAILDSGGHVCAVSIETPRGDRLLFSEKVDDTYRSIAGSGVPRRDEDFHPWLLQRGISRARGAIALDCLNELDGQRFVYSTAEESPQPEREIEAIILRALRRLKRLSPNYTGRVPLDPVGVCLVAGIPLDDFNFVDSRLRDRGLAEGWGIGWDDFNHNEKITELGLQELEGIEARMNHETEGETYDDIEISAGSAEYFVAHEFSPDQIDDLRRAIDEALESSGLQGYYADAELRQGHIFRDKILPKITDTVFGIYDVSNPAKPNVFLELGAGLALDKICIIICKRGTSIPADLGGLDRIEYQSYKDLTSQLKDKLLAYLPPASTGRKLIIRIPKPGAPPN
jgi:hypothetical protein